MKILVGIQTCGEESLADFPTYKNEILSLRLAKLENVLLILILAMVWDLAH